VEKIQEISFEKKKKKASSKKIEESKWGINTIKRKTQTQTARSNEEK
jgi:hypothetical protein